jgi:nitrate/TMAO reductase-like tetraheme cytochrome c subunit
LATLTGGAANLKTISTVKDDYGNVWNEVQLSGFVQGSGLTSNQDTIWAGASALYSARCSTCHALPRTNQFTANQWPTILKAMTKNAALQPDQIALLTQYLQTHSK